MEPNYSKQRLIFRPKSLLLDWWGGMHPPHKSATEHMLPYLKSLHFLPVKFRIEFKIALLTHKCLHGYAPTCLKNLINSRSVSERYSLRVNDDNWLLQTVTSLNFARSQSMFSCASPKVWNSLPLSLREIETLSLFKKRLKAFYFNLAFEDITTV